MSNQVNPFLSIVFTSYNHKEYLKQAIDSLINQTFQDFELIVVDDNSTDGSQEILKEYSSNKKVKLNLLNENTGSYVKASNYGEKLAVGEYLLFAQCDDFSEPNQLEYLIDCIKKNNVGVAFSRSNLVDENGVVFSDDFQGRESAFKEIASKDILITRNQMMNFLSFSCVLPNLSAAIIKRDLYKSSGGLSERFLVAADWAFWLELSKSTDFYYVSSCLNNFRQHKTTIRSKTKIRIQILEIYTIFYEFIKSANLSVSEAKKFRVGAGAIWFWYFIDSPKQWFSSFFEVYKSIIKLEKQPFYYLFCGILKQVREVFIRKFNK